MKNIEAMTAPAPRPSEREIAEDLGEIARLIMWKHLGKHWQAPWYSPLVKDIEAALTEARRAAIEEAAKEAERFPTHHIVVTKKPDGTYRQQFNVYDVDRHVAAAARLIAQDIRSLASPSPGKGT